MPYLHVKSKGYPRYEGDVALAPFDEWVEVTELPYPEVSKYEIVTRKKPTQTAEGNWVQEWDVRQMTKAERKRYDDREAGM